MKNHRQNILMIAGAMIVALSACAHEPQRKFYDLDGPEKAIFLAYYPLLTPDQRKELLVTLQPLELLKEWNLAQIYFRNSESDHAEFAARPENYTIARINVELDRSAPYRTGKGLSLRAVALYLDGRQVDITQDAHWKVLPDVAYMDGHVLHFDCVASDVEVSAQFMEQYAGSRRVEIRKEIQSLDIQVAGRSVAVGPQEFIHMEAIARCSDGSTSNVTCQTEWKTKERARFGGCGVLQLYPVKRATDNEPISITGSYGGVSATRSFEFTPIPLTR